MLTVRYKLNHGYILSITDLRRVLTDISLGARRWWVAEPITLLRDPDKPVFWLTLFHACPLPDQMTDEISFRVPVLPFSMVRGKEESALVCLHPEMVRPLMEGLYLENDRIVGDFLEDWNLFWTPLKKAMGEG